MVAFLAFVPITITVATQIARMTLTQALKKHGKDIPKHIIQTLNKNKKLLKDNKFDKKTNIKVKKQIETINKSYKKPPKTPPKTPKKPPKTPPKTPKKPPTTVAASAAREIKQLKTAVNKLTNIVKPVGGAIKRNPLKSLLGYGAVSATVGDPVIGAGKMVYKGGKTIGEKMFSGSQLETNVKSKDITSEVTGNGADTKASAPATAGSGGIADFISAHNSAMDSGQEWFKFNGQAYRVGSTRMADFQCHGTTKKNIRIMTPSQSG